MRGVPPRIRGGLPAAARARAQITDDAAVFEGGWIAVDCYVPHSTNPPQIPPPIHPPQGAWCCGPTPHLDLSEAAFNALVVPPPGAPGTPGGLDAGIIGISFFEVKEEEGVLISAARRLPPHATHKHTTRVLSLS